jgi:hypothetical protein
MRASLQYDERKARHAVTAFLADDELPDTWFIRFEGKLSDTLTIKPVPAELQGERGVMKISGPKNGGKRQVRIPPTFIGTQPYGRTFGAQPVPSMPTMEGLLVGPYQFTEIIPPGKILHRLPKGGAEVKTKPNVRTDQRPLHEGIKKVAAFRTPDGQLHISERAAVDHIAHVARMELFGQLHGATVAKFTVDDKFNKNCMMIFDDGRVLSLLPNGKGGISIAINGTVI